MEIKRRLLSRYQNGNYEVRLYNDGTKIRENNLDFMIPDFPESFDLKITNYCEMNCPMCHEMSNPNGEHSDILNAKFIETIHPGTEVAIGGGMVTSHPNLEEFLIKLKKLKVYPSMTVHQEEFKKNKEFIKSLIDRKLIYGLGISIKALDEELFKEISNEIPNAVIHTIAGITSLGIFEFLKNINSKVLILGYKNWGRGEMHLIEHPEINNEINNLEKYLFENENYKNYKVMSFDNLALNQLHVRNNIPEELWQQCYQGEDGMATMYIDAVKMEFAQSSISRERHPINDMTIDEMFNVIRV